MEGVEVGKRIIVWVGVGSGFGVGDGEGVANGDCVGAGAGGFVS